MKGSRKSIIKKLAVGTVQFGLDYGISNKSGKPGLDGCKKIIDLAIQYGIDTLDTAFLYGDSEEILGKLAVENFKVVSKFPDIKNGATVADYFIQSLNRLNRSNLYAYLSHNSQDLLNNPGIWEELQEIKASGKVVKIGTSLYSPAQLENLFNIGIIPDLIQIPYSVFDRRFEYMFKELKNKGIEIHTRSAFLQGLFFIPNLSLDPFFEKALSNIKYLQERYPTSAELAGALLAFPLNNPYIDKVVIGVNNAAQLNDNVEGVIQNEKEIEADLTISDENIILPYNWTT